jgi:all-trans-8'-apo-beta-carotenal 15,15'-oxygenase
MEIEWCPGDTKFAMEPFFVARKNATSEDDGWVVALVHDAEYEHSDFGGRGTEMVIIDSKKFKEGPVARLRMPTYVPFGVHGSWSTTHVAGPPKAKELAAIAEMEANGGKRVTPATSLSGDQASTQKVQDGVDVKAIAAVAAAVAGAAALAQLF